MGGYQGINKIPLFPYKSRRHIWKQIVRKRYCKPGTKTDLNIRIILPQGRRSLSVVKTNVMFAHSAHPCCALRTSLVRTARTSATEARLLSHHAASQLVQKVCLTQDTACGIHLHHCETITIAIPCAHMGHAVMVDWAYVAMNKT